MNLLVSCCACHSRRCCSGVWARCGAAFSIEGRGAQLLDPDSTVQNWESGIEVTVIGCTVFRNFAGFSGTLLAMDAWPLVWAVDSTDFVHNEALITPADHVYWTVPVSA